MRGTIRLATGLGLAAVLAMPGWARAGDGELSAATPERVMVMGMTGATVDESLRNDLSEAFTTAIRDHAGPSEVVADADIRAMLTLEAQKQSVGCTDDDSCLAEIAGALGADHLVVANLGRVDDTWLVTARLIDTRRAKTVRHVSEETDGGEGALLFAVRQAGQKLIDPTGLYSTPTLIYGLAVGTMSNILRFDEGVALDLEANVRLWGQLEVGIGFTSPVSVPVSVRYVIDLGRAELSAIGRYVAFRGEGPLVAGRLYHAVGGGVGFAAMWDTRFGRLGVRIETLFTQAIGLGSAAPMSASAVWQW